MSHRMPIPGAAPPNNPFPGTIPAGLSFPTAAEAGVTSQPLPHPPMKVVTGNGVAVGVAMLPAAYSPGPVPQTSEQSVVQQALSARPLPVPMPPVKQKASLPRWLTKR
jgi:hypothetical protein